MRKKVLILLFFLCLNIDILNPQLNDELIDITSFIATHNHTIEKWNVTIKEKISNKQTKQLLSLLQTNYTVKSTESEQAKKYFVQYTDKSNNMLESYSIVVPKNKQYSPELRVSIESNYWNKQISQKYQQRINKISKKLFTNHAHRYTCVTATNNAIIKDINFVNLLEKELDLKNMLTQVDTIKPSLHKKIVYGYTPKWDENIKLLEQRLNIQIVLQKNEDGKTKMIIGTPILINEY